MLALSIVAGQGAARAEDVGRSALIEKAQQAKASGNHDEALRLGRQAAESKMTASLRRFLVEEESALGMWVNAYSDAQKCTREASMEPPSPNHDAVLIGCRTLMHELRGRVGLLVFDFPSPPPSDLQVTLDGRPVEGVLTENEHPASLGEVTLEATASGRPSIRRKILANVDAPTHVVLAFAESALELPATSSAVPIAPAASAPAEVRTVRGPSGPIVAGIGLAAGIGGIVTRAVATGQYNALQDRCRSQGCPDGTDVRARIERLDTIALVSAIGGAALLGLGATLYFVVDKHAETVQSGERITTVSLGIDPRSRGVTLKGAF